MSRIQTKEELIEFLKTKFEVPTDVEELLLDDTDFDKDLLNNNIFVIQDWDSEPPLGLLYRFYNIKDKESCPYQDIIKNLFTDDEDYECHFNEPVIVIDLEEKRAYRMEIKKDFVTEEVVGRENEKNKH